MKKYTYKKLILETFTKIINEIQEKIPELVAYIIKNGKMYRYIPNIEYNSDMSAQHPTYNDEDDDIV